MRKIKAKLMVGCIIIAMMPALTITACADSTFELSGKVRNSDGDLIENVKVVIEKDNLLPGGKSSTSTNSSGEYSFYLSIDGYLNEDVIITFSKRGYKTESISLKSYTYYATGIANVPTVSLERAKTIFKDISILFNHFPLLSRIF